MSILKRKSRITSVENHWIKSQAVILHEYTKYNEMELLKKSPRILDYMSSTRNILETARNVKEYLKEKSISLECPQSAELNFYDLLKQRRSCHQYSGQEVKYQELSNILGWAAGVTKKIEMNKPGLEGEVIAARSYPSGGGLYPCETYIIALNIEQLQQGIYHYDNLNHSLDPVGQGLELKELKRTFLADDFIDQIGFIVVITSMFERQVTKYGDRAYRLALIESGHLMQNILLSATAQNMASLSWGGYHDNEVATMLRTDIINEPPVHVAFVGKGASK